MKQYKLIKKYPGSPKLGFVVKFKPGYDYVSPAKSEAGVSCLLYLKMCKSFPEFWEEVKQINFKVLTVTPKPIHPNLPIGSIKDVWVNINMDYFYIHSVKRLSDKEVFKIGDIDNLGKITGFVIRKNKIISQYHGGRMEQFLSSIERVKPLFTTKDGVDIFKGDKTCWVNNWTITNFTDWKRTNNTQEVHFSTIEAAEEYVLMNKPCLCIQEVIKFFSVTHNDSYVKGLKKIVKEKLCR